jgi:D-alanyl-D-alanine carboxypeptidase/D-alanyl-D-alanine-endopeptidase (penicillin-binding protein 4)
MRSRSSRLVLAAGVSLGLVGCHPTPPSGARATPFPRAALADLQRDLDRTLSAPSGEHAYWGVLAKSLKTDETLYALNAHKLMMPASAMKVVTLAAAADRLGWDFTYETRLFAVGPVESGTLNGDLAVVGSGDPSLTQDVASKLFSSWAERLKVAGIRAVSGRVVGDDNAFDDEELGAGWSWDDLADGFATGVSALQYNENTVRATITPGSEVGSPAAISLAPAGSGLILTNLVRTAPADSQLSMAVRRAPGSGRLELRGSVPLGGGPFARTLAVTNPTLFFVAALRDALIAKGIDVRGPPVDIDDIVDAPSLTGAPLAAYRSPPLSTLAVTLMKLSQNLYAETLLKTIGVASGTPTFEGGRAAVRSTLAPWGLPAGELIQVDGSGLSRYGYATAATLVGILTHVDRDDKLRGPYEASLPIAGRDGTLTGRLVGTRAEGNVRAKTGTMSNVRALAGYVTSRDGDPIVFAILANNFESAPDAIIGTIDAVVVRLAEFHR